VATAAPEIPVLARDQAFESLYRHYVKDVYHYALALLRNPADAEDVTQTTFLNAYRAFQRGVEVEKPQNWLIKIAHNVARTRYARAGRRVKEVPLDDHLEELAVPEADRPDVEVILRALGRLPFNQRGALVMRELEGRTYAEIADTIGVSVSAVETLIFRARKSLRLKASSLRGLAAVPLPSSLAQLFDGGGLVAGSGATVGTGFLVKAAMVLVAGAVASGVGGGRGGPGPAVAGSKPKLVSGESWQLFGAQTIRRLRSDAHGVRATGRHQVRVQSTSGHWKRHALRLNRPTAVPRPTHTQESSPGTESDSTSSPSASQLSAPVQSVASTVEAAAQTVVTALPVEAPSLPPPPVDVPQIPGGTPLP
jgi:RNA polymerase sigma factor (sigma-70 family)